MSPRPGLLLACLIVGCAADAPPHSGVFGAPGPRLEQSPRPPDGLGARAEPADTAASAWERALRQELAEGEEPVAAALQLAQWLCDEERHREALAVADVAVRRCPDDLRAQLLRAGLLRDLGRRGEAAAVLRRLTGEVAPGDVHPSLLLTRAELEWLEGQPLVARQLLLDLRSHHQGDAWLTARREDVAVLEAAIRGDVTGRSLPVRDLMGDLRGSLDPARRLVALESLRQADPEVRARAVATAVVDAHPAIRSAGINAAELQPPALLELLQAALSDPAAVVRAAAADRCRDLGRVGAGLLVAALEQETDAATFVRIHEHLRRLLPPAEPLPPGAADDPAVRVATVQAWRLRWGK